MKSYLRILNVGKVLKIAVLMRDAKSAAVISGTLLTEALLSGVLLFGSPVTGTIIDRSPIDAIPIVGGLFVCNHFAKKIKKS